MGYPANVVPLRCIGDGGEGPDAQGGGEADEIAEEDGYDLPLLLDRGRRLLGQWRSTKGAEGELAGELPTAGRAGRHARSLGRLTIGDGSVASSDSPAHSHTGVTTRAQG